MFRVHHARCPLDGARLLNGRGDPLVGTWFAERFLIEAIVSDGETGRVYRARRLRGGHRYAVKVLWGEVATDARARARVVRSATRASHLDHPGLLPVLEVGEVGRGLPYVVTDLIDGDSLAERVLADGPLEGRRAAALFAQVAAGLAHAHERGVLHRRLDAGDVLVSRVRGREMARLGGFGVADAVHPAPPRARPRDDLHRLGSLMHSVVAAPAESDRSASDAAELAAEAGLHQLARRMLEDLIASVREVAEALEHHGPARVPRQRRRRREAGSASRARSVLADRSS